MFRFQSLGIIPKPQKYFVFQSLLISAEWDLEIIGHFSCCFRFCVVFAESLQERRSLCVVAARRVALQVSAHCSLVLSSPKITRWPGCFTNRASFDVRVMEWRAKRPGSIVPQTTSQAPLYLPPSPRTLLIAIDDQREKEQVEKTGKA